MKIVVFDLDETLGYFTEFGIFWDCVNNYFKNINKKLDQTDFNSILSLYPEFVRPNIVNILAYLKTNKKAKCCEKIMIYTNNQGPKEWAYNIINYFENQIKYKLFDQIISAFKVNGKVVELCRTTHDKCHKDFIRCTQIPENAEICFLDDIYHPEMVHDNIYYINIKPYYYDLKFEDMIYRFTNSKMYENVNNADFNLFMMNEFRKYNYTCIEKTKKEYEIDKILGKQMMNHLVLFLKKNISKPPKQTSSSFSKTKKYIKNTKNIKNKKNKTYKS